MIKIIRTIHRWVGFIFAMFFIISAITGFILVFRKNIPENIEDFIFNIHTYEILGIFKYFALIVALALFGLSISGIILFIDVQLKKFKKDKG
ncbi:MAG: hypothetical protein ACP5RD_06640 [bacterium]|jgi:uncharacterized iron-regulated membrane protein